jgi:uncharacterized protein YndB with AHSA1/START domain
MSNAAEGTRTVVMERVFPHAPEKVWRALTESQLVAQWLMKNDFEPVVGRRFQLRSDPVPNWDGVIECEVLVVEPAKRLSYTWSTMGMGSEVLFTLTPADGGTRVRMEHSGFPQDNDAAYKGATYGWQNFLGKLDTVVAGLK